MTMIGLNGKKLAMKESDSILVLFDSSSNIEELKKILHKKPMIFSFDYDSHEILQKNNISHEISDKVLSRDDLVTIQNHCYDLIKWFEEKKIEQLIEYEGINLGLLVKVELNYYLVQFVKKFVEIIKIFNKNRNAHFFTSSLLYEIILSLTSSVTKLNHSDLVDNDFYYDSTKITLKIKNHAFSMRLSKNQFVKIKNLFERILYLFFGSIKLKNYTKTILLVEFDSIKYEKIFQILPNMPLNLISFNRRRPSIWNFESFSIIKNSGCSVVTTSALLDAVAKNRIKNGISKMTTKIDLLWENEDFFESFFSINESSFWKILKPKFKELFTKRVFEFVPEIEITKRLLEKYHFSSVLVLSEIGSTEQIIVKLAKQLGIKIVLLQHGLFYDSGSQSAYKMNKFQGVFPIDADKYVVWGNIEETHQLKYNISKDKLQVLGSPSSDSIFDIKTTNKTQDFILLATSGPLKENALDLTVETIQKNQQTIRKICQAVSQMNKNLVIKLHPSQDEFDPTKIAKEIDPRIIIQKTGNPTQLVQSCEVLVVIDASTIILDAHLLKKPVISVLVKDSDYGIPSVLQNSCVMTDMNNFEITLKRVLTDVTFKNELINKGTNYVNQYLVKQGEASKELLNLLNTL